ncbi:MAG: PepSY-associated TM helix domain-containing protein [Myxococcota bacterium]
MGPRTTRMLLTLHRRCGLFVCLNLAVLSLTGVILVFHEEIDTFLGAMPEARGEGALVSLAETVEVARASRPEAHPVFVFQEPDAHPHVVFVGLTEGAPRIEEAEPVAVDRRGGELLGDIDLRGSFTGLVLQLHAELFLGPFGKLLTGAIGLAFLVSLLSGVAVYGPMMRRFRFGMLRVRRARRTLVADLHKLVGVATLGWTLVVAVTGILLSLGSILLQVYATTELAALGAHHADAPLVTDLRSLDAAVASAEATEPGRHWAIVALPGSDLASPRDYSVLLQGKEGLEQKVMTMALVDALAPERAEAHAFPWYLQALMVSEPLHFGDYGGWPLKLVWALLGLATLLVSLSGVWVFGRSRRDARARRRTEALDTDAEAARAEPMAPEPALAAEAP